MIENLHQKLINALPCIPSLYESISEILIKISNSFELYQADISLMLLSLAGKLSNELLNDPSLAEVTSGMVELSVSEIEANFEQLSACLIVMQNLAVKCPEILEIIRGNNFSSYAIKFLQDASEDVLDKNWIGSVFSIVDILIKSGDECNNNVVPAILKVLKVNATIKTIIISESEMLSLLNLLVTVTFTPNLGKTFIEGGGLENLLLAKSTKSDTQNKGIINA